MHKLTFQSFLIACFSIVLNAAVLAQVPTWAVNPASFANNMNLTGQIYLDGNEENGNNNLLAAFVGNEVRGIASPIMVGGKAYYFLTIYSNAVLGETLNFKVYLSDHNSIHPALEEIDFLKNSQAGGYPNGFAVNISLGNDFPIDLLPIPPANTLSGYPFEGVELENYLSSQDNDPVAWSVTNGVNLIGSLGAGDVLTVSPVNPTWTGTDSVLVTATETGTTNAFSASKYARFTIGPDYGAPFFGEIPVQFLQEDVPLPEGNLNDFLDFDGPCVEFSVEMILPYGTEAMPAWLQPTSNSGTMSLVVQPNFGGNMITGTSNKMAAFINGILAGVASPQMVLGKELYFLTLANVGKGEIVLKFYDANHQYLHEKAAGSNFMPTGSLGNFNDPFVVDFAPFLINLSADGSWVTTVLDPNWLGEQHVMFFAKDCKYGNKVGSVELVFLSNQCPSEAVVLPEGFALCLVADIGVSDITWFLDGNEIGGGPFFGASVPGIYHYEGLTPQGCPDVKSCPIVVIEGPDLILPSGGFKTNMEKSFPPSCGETVLAGITLDDTSPTAICKSASVSLDANGTAILTANDVNNGSFTSCGAADISISQENFNCLNFGMNKVILTIEDAAGRTANCSAMVTVGDNIAPSVTCKNRTVVLNASGSATILPNHVFKSGSDNCGTVNLVSVSPNSFYCSKIGANTVTLTVNDSHGNTKTCTATVTVNDTTKPTVVCKNYTVVLNASGSAAITPANVFQSGTDNCGAVNLISVSPNSFNCNNIGTNAATLTVNDGHGNTRTCTATVTVQDNTAPVPICPAAIPNVLLNSSGTGILPANIGDGSSTDNCGVTETSPAMNFTCTHVGTQAVALTVSDGTNTATTVCTFTVVDPVAPSANCTGQTITANLNADGEYIINPSDLNNGSTDACGSPTFSASPSTLSCQNEGLNTVTLTVTDNSGNPETCTAIVNVAPFITNISITPVGETCAGAGDGAVNIAATAGGGQVMYSIDGGVNFSASGNFVNLTPGNYSIVIKVFGIPNICEKTSSVNVATGGAAQIWYKDADNDGWSDGVSETSCTRPIGYKTSAELNGNISGDCNDLDANAFPGQTWYKDSDNDNYTNGTTQTACLRPVGHKTASELFNTTDIDCNDNNAVINHGATEICNGIDDDCDGQIDEGTSGGLTYVGNLNFTTQQQVDNFSPCYSVVDGNVIVTGTNIKDLDPFVNLVKITGNLTIQSTHITKMDGFDNLDSLGGTLVIYFNSKLKTLDGLDSLSSVGGALSMYYNFKLDECCAIYDLINGGIAGATTIFFNKAGCNSVADINNNCTPPPPLVGGNGGSLIGTTKDIKEAIVFPNPAKNSFTVTIPEQLGNGKIQVSDITGRPVKEIGIAEGQTSYRFDCGQLAPGVYLVCVKSVGQPMEVIRLVVRLSDH